MILLIFILVCYGISNILVYGSIFEGWRKFLAKMGTGDYSLYKLFTCMMCLPTWIGFLVSFVMMYTGGTTPVAKYLSLDDPLLIMFLDGVLASGGVYAFNVLVEKLEQ